MNLFLGDNRYFVLSSEQTACSTEQHKCFWTIPTISGGSGSLMKTAQLGVKIKQWQTNTTVNDLQQTGKCYSRPIKKNGRTSNWLSDSFFSNKSSQCHRNGGNLTTYHTKSLQTEQKVGWLKKMAVNSWLLTTWTLGCLKAPLLLFSVVTPSSGITFTDSLLGTAGRKVSHVHRSGHKSVFSGSSVMIRFCPSDDIEDVTS